MQLLFGVLGTNPTAGSVFDRLAALTAESNPGIRTEVETAPGLRVGRHVRSFGRWDDAGTDLTLILDGEIRSIDGRDTTGHGTTEPELAEVAGLYRRLGTGVWKRLEGSFRLLIRDGRTIRIGFDVAGARALYWWACGGVLAFHSQLLDLAPTYPGELAEDAAGVAGFLAHGYYPFSTTAFEGIGMAGAGQYLEAELEEDGVRAAIHDHFRFVPAAEPDARPIETLADELNDLLTAGIARSWRSAERPVVPLSGGVDSRYIAAELVRLSGDPAQVETITWGEHRARPGSDGVVAPKVAAALGVPNTWHEKPQVHTNESLGRSIYLSSGESDAAISYPGNHLLYERLVADPGYRSMFRGDQLFGEAHQLMTHRAVFAASGLSRIRLDPVYRRLLDPGLVGRMADAQDALLERVLTGLAATTPQAKLYELKYATTWRRELSPNNTVKHMHLEVHTPLFGRATLEWVRGLPDSFRADKRVFRVAIARRFPELSRIPFATCSNLPDWSRRARTDPSLARAFREWCEQPGWLHSIGADSRVIAALSELEAAARSQRAGGSDPGDGRPTARQRLNQRLRDASRTTRPGRLVREWTMERRAIGDHSMYARLSRLAVVHGLIGHARARHAQGRPAGR